MDACFVGLNVLGGSQSVRRGNAACARVAPLQMAHHVEFKNTRKHTHRRPKKHALSDRNRAPPPYPVDVLRSDTSLPPVMTIVKADAPAGGESKE
mmetsp:Transcript_17682/g.38362  ORF Transcript_17682/g.38362 Transcript_17682/m.38362 type:complete len:95 (+) Transcript_17682:112-396(+)|eukprot:CAMPEP_0185849884 /NCGR_PEP_ID=MMETSP1354-20130828/4231_1 /TAXON_ID=708628 /ORGANISM="Erythrolobus madagascarensis, Strain CCMP3276" /LENGTH=94 /DNA_ID=CAMNT_0028550487 /DNA_START=40 /DNA_END=324 /DNA_ORIENTATION=+